jgi:hypothetical protein
MRVIVCGSRTWNDRAAIADVLHDLALTLDTPLNCTIVHGNARGADRIAAQEALKAGFYVEAHPADWEQHGKAAGPIRNQRMADLGADLCIAFWDGASAGTRHMVDLANRRAIRVKIVAPETATPPEGGVDRDGPSM